MNITLTRTVELTTPILPEVLPAPLYEGESNAHTFIISATKNKEAQLLSGSVIAFFDRPDETTVRVNGQTKDGKAHVTLTHECYAVSGAFFLRVMLLNGETQVVIYSASGRMRKKADGESIDGGSTPGGGIVPPGGITEETDPTVPDWAKQPEKPTYTADEVGALPASTKIPSKTSDLTNDSGFITQETDPTVPAWAKQPEKPAYTADEVGALPASTKIPSKTSELTNDSGFITQEADPTVPAWAKQPNKPAYTADEVGALPASTKIPAKTSDLTNDSGFITKTASDLANYYAKSESYTRVEIDQKISAIPKFSIAVVDSLPSYEISETTVYLLKSGEGSDLYTEFISVDGTWEILGSQRVDLTGYATETWTLGKLAEYQPKGDYAQKSEIPTNVSEFNNDAGYLVDEDIAGKLDATELPNAINQALAQAKESGEFDGKDAPQEAVLFVNQTLTDEQKAQARENIGGLGKSQVFDVTKIPLFTNVLDLAPLEYGKILNTNGTVSDTAVALCVTGYIPIVKGQTVRMEDIALYNGGSARICLYGSDYSFKTMVGYDIFADGGYYVGDSVQDENGNFVKFTVLNPGSLAFIKICTNTATIGNNPVITIDEEIVYEDGYGKKLNKEIKVDYSQIINSPQKNGWNILPYERINIAYSSIGRKPINTLEHFADAAENFGYNALKCDVRPTSDGELVCCHDAGFTFNSSGYITTYNSSNATMIHNVTAATCLGYSFTTGEHPCLVGAYLDVCRKYGKVAFVTIRNEYMDVVIPKLLEELRIHNMTYATIINCMTYESLVQWRQQDQTVMINYTLNAGVAIDQAQIDRAIGLGYCSLCGFGLNSSLMEPNHTCDFEYARANGIRLLQAIAYKEGSPEACYALGYDGCQIAYPWGSPACGGVDEDTVQSMIDDAIGAAIGGSY